MSFKRLFKSVAKRAFQVGVSEASTHLPLSKLYTASGEVAAFHVRALERVKTLADAEFSIFSQWGEDGIIEWLLHHNGAMPEIFVEFGVESYRESNTRFLMVHRNWRGLILDGSPANIAVVSDDAVSWRHDLTSKTAFVTTENIDALIRDAGFNGEIGVLSVDIDGNDYWVWDAIGCINPHFVIAEYNAVFGDVQPLTVPYDPAFMRTTAHHSNLYYGASIAAMCALAERKGYTLLGTNRAGVNAFFVRNDRLAVFQDRVADRRPRPSRFRESRDRDGAKSLVRGKDRAGIIADCPVVNIADGRTAPLREFGELYSARWLAMLDGHVGGELQE